MPQDKVRVIISTDDDVQYNGHVAQDVRSKAAGVAQSAASTVQDVSSKAKDVALSTASTVQDTVQTGLTTTQRLLLGALDVAQSMMSRNFKRRNFKKRNFQKQANKNLKKTQKRLLSLQGTVQENVQSGLSKTQDTLQTGLSLAQVAMNKNAKRASKNLQKAQKKAQKNLSSFQGTLQDSVQSGLSKTQDALQSGLGTATDVLGKTTKTATKNLKKVTGNVKDVQDSLQDRVEAYQRKRARAKFLFRMGLVLGIVATLLYTPWPGSQMRQLVIAYWQQFSQRVQGWFNEF
jgi:hypothetical protein